MVRSPWFDKNGTKKGAWSKEEDRKLKAHINENGHGNWRELPRLAGLKRCGKSCRLRWMNYLRPDLKLGSYTIEEEDLVIQLHQQYGNKWAMIASKLPGRSDNDIKNYWHTHLEKRVTGPKKLACNNNKTQKTIDGYIVESVTSQTNSMISYGDHIQILESCPLSSSEILAPSSTTTSSCDISTSSTFSSFDMSVSSLIDDVGLEGIFAEMSSLILGPTEHDGHDLSASFEGESVPQETPITVDDVCGEVGLEEDDFWSQAVLSDMHNNEVLSSPCLDYFDESFFDGLLFEQTMQEMMP